MTHWHERVNERIGNVDPDELAQGIVWAIENDRTDLVRAVARVSRTGRRVFRFKTPDGRVFFALVDTNDMKPITVFPPDYTVNRWNGPPLHLAKYA